MTILAYLALFGWIPAVIVMFAMMPICSAATLAVVGSWLILPPYQIDIVGLPDYSKNMAASIGMTLAVLIFAPEYLLRFRLRWFDLPVILFSICGIASSLSNGLGLYDGLSNALAGIITWALPYLLGRILFGDPAGMRFFCVGMIIGGLAYVLPCIYEMRMGPVLLANFYGFSGMLMLRFGGYRPKVFFWTGLECSFWMTATTLTAWWLWNRGAIRQVAGLPAGPVVVPVLFMVSILCRSTGAVLLMLAGMAILWLSARFRTRLLLIGLMLVGPIYIAVRIPNYWTGQNLVDLAAAWINPERAESLGYRFNAENLLVARAMQQPLLGWGGWGRNEVYFDEERTKVVAMDGMWIITLGLRGLIGLSLWLASMLLPAVLFIVRFPPRTWDDPRLAAGMLAATFLGIYTIDCLLNGFVNIIYLTLAGGLVGLDPRQLRTAAVPRTAGAVAAAAFARRPTPETQAASGRLTLADRCRSLGRGFRQEGRLDQADAAWNRALELLAGLIEADPGSDDLRRRWCDCANDLAWLRANHPDPARRDPHSARTMARRAVDDFPDSPPYWNTLGVACYRAGDDDAAIEALERSRDLNGGTAFDDVFLSMAHARRGDLTQARQELARALLRAERDFPGHPELAAFCDEAHILIDGAAAPAAP